MTFLEQLTRIKGIRCPIIVSNVGKRDCHGGFDLGRVCSFEDMTRIVQVGHNTLVPIVHDSLLSSQNYTPQEFNRY
jgi:hypothetical protein